uniref:Uncharacterized protein n=1 Tax=Chromera velia CCMP2878 TaxID=1169474 RepID=A0A0G4FUI4_9ALVE|eukprot:Cvel_18759.t1-p1 / transcript=Cvel_18759.t1 / gene=Cvel_18759 / organism=Chromera_velia_CCMP2878 / gene_product=hypothetical protein / transcript_product=hypothetical protein / location=Cvel_scaffold1574:8586-9266(+) / protein_length=164 / sequence_SO=supercontig / SO=protein_coding / is_pseudo=false
MTFEKKASLQLKPQYVSDRAKAYEGALLHAAGDFDEVQKTIHNRSAEGHTCEDLLFKVLGDFVKDMSVVKTKADRSFIEFLIRVKGESLKHYFKKADAIEYKIAVTGASSQKKPSADEFGASAEKTGAATEKGKGKGKKPKKGKKKQQQVQADFKETAGKASDR